MACSVDPSLGNHRSGVPGCAAAYQGSWPQAKGGKTTRRISEGRGRRAAVGHIVELMGKAHSRGPTTLAESAVQAIISSGGPLAPKTLKELSDLVGAAVATHPVGAAEADAAIAAIAELGVRHPLLLEPALVGLSQMTSWRKSSMALESALEKLKSARRAAQEQEQESR
jgi:hypothetical protein